MTAQSQAGATDVIRALSAAAAAARLYPDSSDIPRQAQERFAELERQYPEGADVPVPDTWGGWLIRPAEIEFWQASHDRRHIRHRYEPRG